ncbi:MAG: hypothetical protein ACJA01_002993 [Saprospiraceae bacterium]
MGLSKKTLVGTVGYHILGNHSMPPMLFPHLQKLALPEYVKVDELNWGPVAVVQMFEAEQPAFERVVIVCAIEREEREIGQISIYKWEGGLPDEEQIQACVGDAATGVISVENLLVIGEFFKVWKDEVYLVDVEPGSEVAGEQLTPEMEVQIPNVLSLVRQLAIGELKDKGQVQYLFGNKIFEEANTT